jgi:hypothetical protein
VVEDEDGDDPADLSKIKREALKVRKESASERRKKKR